jgi:hypothetical protein
MYNHYGIATLDDLIREIEINMKINDPYNDNLYLKKFKEFLKYNIKWAYGNILTVASVLPMRKFNDKEGIQWEKEKKEIVEYFENIERSKTKSKKYYLISVEYYNGYPILIIGEPDGLNFEGKMNNKARIYEIKSFNLMYFYTIYGSKENEYFIKKVLNKIKTISNQLIVYQYLLENTIKFGLIRKIEKVNLYGRVYFYSKNIGDLYSAKRIIKQNFNRIIKDLRKYNAYNLSLKEEENIYINGENVYYFKINFRTKYNQKTVENYLNNLNKLLKSLKLVDNGNL